ncbi:MAG TPA: MerR family transcriptional regulator [Roseiflexaceae bacterium]|nr:MerR family transcriptional regulator [Roseiflexaceae bacterium]
MFKIGDFSRLGQVSVRMLRHYDKLGLLKPSHTDPQSGYRYYTIDQLARLNRIVALNGIGLTLQQIGGLLGERGELPAEQLRGMLVLRRAELEQELHEKQAQLAGVAARLRQIELEGQPSPYEIVVKPVEPLAVASVRALVPTMGQMDAHCAMLYDRLYNALERRRIAPRGLELTLYHNSEYTEVDLDVETAAEVDPALLGGPAAADGLLFRELPGAPLAATLVYEGGFDGVGAAVLALLGWVGLHGHTVAGPLRELHLSGPVHAGGLLREPAVLEIQVPIAPVGGGEPG